MSTIRASLTNLKYKTQLYAAHGIDLFNSYTVRRALYKNHDFVLVYTRKRKNGSFAMRIVRPAHSRRIRKLLEVQGYNTLSHVWGSKDEWKPWTNHPILGDDGKPVPVDIRQEKQQTILALLRKYPGFWWIDVFCAQSETPPVIMGDVYRFCKCCYALVDIPSSGLQEIKDLSERLQLSVMINDYAEEYKKRIDGKKGHQHISWHETLDDLLGWYSDSSTRRMGLADLFDCTWFTRVWTLQEFVLPRSLKFVSESGPVKHDLDRTAITPIFSTLDEILHTTLKLYMDEKFDDYNPDSGFLGLTETQHNYAADTPGLSRCYFDISRLTAFHIFKLFEDGAIAGCTLNISSLRYVSSKYDTLVLLVTLLARMPRTCMEPCDYIYGVAGLLDMNIPRIEDHYQVWTAFKNTLRVKSFRRKFIS